MAAEPVPARGRPSPTAQALFPGPNRAPAAIFTQISTRSGDKSPRSATPAAVKFARLTFGGGSRSPPVSEMSLGLARPRPRLSGQTGFSESRGCSRLVSTTRGVQMSSESATRIRAAVNGDANGLTALLEEYGPAVRLTRLAQNNLHDATERLDRHTHHNRRRRVTRGPRGARTLAGAAGSGVAFIQHALPACPCRLST